MERVILNNGEYEVIEDLKNGVFKCLRHGEEWQNLIGDNLILTMMYRIQELESEVGDLQERLDAIPYGD